MALRIGELPFAAQLLLYAIVFAGVVAGGQFYGPVKDANAQLNDLDREVQTLRGVVTQLQDAKRRQADLQTTLRSLEEQLVRVAEVVPEKKQTDDFIRLLQASSRAGDISLRRITRRDVVYKDFYAEMPFEVEIDGAYYSVMEFFKRLGASTRIVNASALKLEGADPARPKKYTYAPGTSVSGTCTITTFYTPSPEEQAAAAPPTRPGAPARGR